MTEPLPDKHLPCDLCGVAVAPPFQRTEDVVIHQAWVTDMTMTDRQRLQTEYVKVTRCRACEALTARARSVLAAHPAVVSRLGGVAEQRLLAALTVADVLSQPVTLDSPAEVLRVVSQLWPSGRRWQVTAHPGEVASARWSYLDSDARQKLRDAAAELLRDRTVRPTPPPEDSRYRGCLLCGVPSVVARPSARVWTHHRFLGRPLGGDEPTRRYDGYLCPPCEAAYTGAGAIGPTAMQLALRVHLSVPRRSWDEPLLVGLKAWVVVSPDTPNATPWAHLGDLGEAARLLAG